jgi:uncharacterized protein (TIGR02231 family)
MAKRTLLSFFLIFLFIPLLNAALSINAPISSVTVFQGRALVERSALVDLASGDTQFEIAGLPPELYDNTLLVYKEDKDAPFLVKEFEYRQVEEVVVLKDAETKLKAKLDELQELLKSKQDRLEILSNKIKFYSDISAKTSGQAAENLGTKSVDVKNTGEVLAFISLGMENSLKEKRAVQAAVIKVNDDIKIIQSKLTDVYSKNTGASKILNVRLSSSVPVKARLIIKYIVPNAGWYPYYECNYISSDGIIEAKYYAMIQQSTGEKWNNTKIVVATGSPLYDVTLPAANPWIVEEQQFRAYSGAQMKMSMAAAPAPSVMTGEAAADNAVQPAQPPQAVDNYKSDELGIKAVLSGRFDVLNTGEVKKASIKEMKLKRKDIYYTAVPSRNEAAYLTVEFENNDDMLMMPGETSLSIDGNYSGKANIDSNVRKGETLKFSFGIDENIKVIKTKLQEKKGESGIFGSDKKLDFGYRITVENYKAKEAPIYIKEPLPFSENDKIKVEMYESSDKPDYEEDRGIKVWKINLKPGEKKEITYRFRVTYPKDMNVSGL